MTTPEERIKAELERLESIYKSSGKGNYSSKNPEYEYEVTACQTFPKLLAALREMSEALEKTQESLSKELLDDDLPNWDSLHKTERRTFNAITKVAQILGGGK